MLQALAGALAATGRRHRRGDDVLDAVAGAGAAVVARDPAAVLEADLVEGIPPVLPEEVLVQPGGEVVPGQCLVLMAMAVYVVLEGHAVACHGVGPELQVEVLAPLLEDPAVSPDVLDDGPQAPVAPG